jgi:hypothetical protein
VKKLKVEKGQGSVPSIHPRRQPISSPLQSLCRVEKSIGCPAADQPVIVEPLHETDGDHRQPQQKFGSPGDY